MATVDEIAARVDQLSMRIQQLEDHNAIYELKHKYFRSADRHDLEGVRDCFAPEGTVIEFEGFPRCEGRDNFIRMMSDQGGKPGYFTMHHGHNAAITLTSKDTATGEWSLYYCAIDARNREIAEIGGVYYETYVRADGRWYIRTSRFERQSYLVRTFDETGNLAVSVIGRNFPWNREAA